MKGLSEAGYAKTSFKQKSLQTVIESGKGVYQLKHVKTQHGLSSMAGVTITSVDPGQVQIIQGVRAIGDFWSRSKVPELIDLGEHVSYSGSEYSEKIRSNIARQGEQKRRQINTENSGRYCRKDCTQTRMWISAQISDVWSCFICGTKRLCSSTTESFNTCPLSKSTSYHGT